MWVNPAASDADTVYANNRAATKAALGAGAAGMPQVADVLSLTGPPANPFYTAPGGTGPGERR